MDQTPTEKRDNYSLNHLDWNVIDNYLSTAKSAANYMLMKGKDPWYQHGRVMDLVDDFYVKYIENKDERYANAWTLRLVFNELVVIMCEANMNLVYRVNRDKFEKGMKRSLEDAGGKLGVSPIDQVIRYFFVANSPPEVTNAQAFQIDFHNPFIPEMFNGTHYLAALTMAPFYKTEYYDIDLKHPYRVWNDALNDSKSFHSFRLAPVS